MNTIGKTAIMLAICQAEDENDFIKRARKNGYLVCRGRVGSMKAEKVISAVETAGIREGLLDGSYRQEHALYHTVLEALRGICRGDIGIGDYNRTVGLSFSIVIGPKDKESAEEGQWIAVGLYGSIGAPKKGHEHEVFGLGISPI